MPDKEVAEMDKDARPPLTGSDPQSAAVVRKLVSASHLLFALALAGAAFWSAGSVALLAVSGVLALSHAALVFSYQRRTGEFDSVEYGIWTGPAAAQAARRETVGMLVIGLVLLAAAASAAVLGVVPAELVVQSAQ